MDVGLQEVIRRGEGPALEFKVGVPRPEHLARTIAAFANADGGILLLGVDDRGHTPGLHGPEAHRAFEDALRLLSPVPEVILTEYPYVNNRRVVRIDVSQQPGAPVLTPDGYFRRTGAAIEALPAPELAERSLATATADLEAVVAPLSTALESLTMRTMHLGNELAEARRWRRRFPDILLGAAISAVLGLFLALAFLN